MALPLLIPVALEIAKLTAPHVARWLAGDNAAQAAEKIIDTASSVVGAGSPQEILERLRADATLRAETAIKMAELDADLERAYLEDRADARKRDVAIQASGRRNWRADIMVLTAAGGLVACIWAIVTLREMLTGEAIGLIATVAGIFGACLKDAFSFEFGSSRSSKDHAATISAIVKNGHG